MRFINICRNMNFLSVLILALLVAGCSGAISPSATATIIAPLATSPQSTDSATPFPTATLQVRPTITVEQECIPIEEQVPDDLVLSGVWVRNEITPYIENLDEHVDYIVPFEGGGLLDEMAVSPDGKYLAYIDYYYKSVTEYRKVVEKRILRVIKSSGHSLPMDYWVEDWQYILGWVDNRNIALFTGNNEVIILNPFTGGWERFQQPQWLNSDNSNYWKIPHYSPTLEWVLARPDYRSLALQSVQTGETVWQADYIDSFTWSADGSVLAVASSKFIYMITRGKQLAQYHIGNIEADSIRTIRLSPDGRKFAFTNYDPAVYEYELFIFDVTPLKVSRLCTDGFTVSNIPIWSPDSRYIVQEIYDSYYEQFDVLIDTQQMRAYKLISGCCQHRIVWLAKP